MALRPLRECLRRVAFSLVLRTGLTVLHIVLVGFTNE